jgi:DNA-binding MarR family transcriptional regulator
MSEVETTLESVDRVLQAMREIFHELARGQQEMLLHSDLSMAQVKAFMAIAKDGDPSVGVVAKELHIGLSAASQMVERLVKAGLVERRPHPHDRRITQCVLSGRGRELHRQFEARPRMLRAWLERLDGEDLMSLQKGIGALAAVAAGDRREGEE